MLTAMALRGHPLLSCVVIREKTSGETVASGGRSRQKRKRKGARADELPGAARRIPKTGKRL